jgi:hypothetical protein
VGQLTWYFVPDMASVTTRPNSVSSVKLRVLNMRTLQLDSKRLLTN